MNANTSANTPCHPHPLLCAPRVELQLRFRFELLVDDRLLLVLFLLLFLLLARAFCIEVISVMRPLYPPIDT